MGFLERGISQSEEHKHNGGHTCMPLVGFEPTVLVFESRQHYALLLLWAVEFARKQTRIELNYC
jgi:hypothetical protein